MLVRQYVGMLIGIESFMWLSPVEDKISSEVDEMIILLSVITPNF